MNFLSFYKQFTDGAFPWQALGHGSYNRVYVSKNEIAIDKLHVKWVCKQPIIKSHEKYALNDPVRAHRKWSEFNPFYPAYLSPDKALWFMPYLGHKNATDDEMFDAIIDLYRRTGNIVADGGMISNFVKVDEKAVCLDVDLSIRRNSIHSENFFNEIVASDEFDIFFADLVKQERPKTLNCIKVLFFIEDCLSGYEFDHQVINHYLLYYCFNFARQGYAIDPIIFHNLTILSQNPPKDLQSHYFHPVYLSKLPKCDEVEELLTHLVEIYEHFDEVVVQDNEKDDSVEAEVADVLDEMVNLVAKTDVFENQFFRHLSKRTVFASSVVEVNKDSEIVAHSDKRTPSL